MKYIRNQCWFERKTYKYIPTKWCETINPNIAHIHIHKTQTGSVCKITHIYACTCRLARTCSISLHLLLRATYFLLSRALLSSSSCAVLSSSSLPPGPSSTYRQKLPVFVLCVWLSVFQTEQPSQKEHFSCWIYYNKAVLPFCVINVYQSEVSSNSSRSTQRATSNILFSLTLIEFRNVCHNYNIRFWHA